MGVMPLLIALIALGVAWSLDPQAAGGPGHEPTPAPRTRTAPGGSARAQTAAEAQPRARTEPPARAQPAAGAQSAVRAHPGGRAQPRVEWRDSVAVGTPGAGRLIRGVRLPAEGRGYFTWDPVLRRRPDRDWRRWGTDDLVRTTLRVLREFHRRNPGTPRVGVGDLSLPRGGYFGAEVGGGIGHDTHQNGLDVDVYYPRLDRRERPPETVDQVDLELAQELVDLFVEAGATDVYVGPNLPLTGPAGVVTPLVNHDNHLHARIAP
jgi:Penicillin-insensitive murein endopeptidase